MKKLVLLSVCSLMLFSCGKTKEELEEEVYYLEEEKRDLEDERLKEEIEELESSR